MGGQKLYNLIFNPRNVTNVIEGKVKTQDGVSVVINVLLVSDAWSKFPYTGMQVSTRQEWGTFDQCVAIDYQPEDGPRILGKHCANGLALPVSTEVSFSCSKSLP